MKVSDYVVSFLKGKGVKYVFEMSGGMITHLLDSLNRDGSIRIISVHHEQTASFAADAIGRLTGIPGIAMATSGPGATNLLTGIGSCYFDSSPAVFITGQVNRNEIKGDRKIRQLGFQETDIVSISKPITKASWQAQTPEEVPHLLSQAFDLAVSGRPGPVLIDLPMDIQRSDISSDIYRTEQKTIENRSINDPNLKELFDMIKDSKQPLILAGGGIRAARVTESLRKLVHRIHMPVVNSLMGVDVLPYDDPYRVGLIGSYGNRWANLAMAQSDLLLVLGSRLDVRQTGSQIKEFKGDRTIFHVDCESGEINNRIQGCIPVIMDLKEFFILALKISEDQQFSERKDWLKKIEQLRCLWPDISELSKIKGINPNIFMHKLSSVSKQASVYAIDVGQHQMWAAQSLELGPDQKFLTSGGMGSMGFGLPAAIGAAFSVSPTPVIVIAGDGGFQANIQELQTVVRNQLPIKIIVLNNRCHGMVRQFQESLFEKRYQSTLWGYTAPNFASIATAYGISSKIITDEKEISSALEWLWKHPSEPSLLEVIIDTYTNAYPKISFGNQITNMEPFSDLNANNLI